MKVTIKNLYNIENYIPNEKSILISIIDNEETNIDFYNKYIKVLKLDIDDIDICIYKDIDFEKYNIFNINHYNKIIEFIQEDDINEIVIHCSLGISRSPAIAIGICKYLRLEDQYKKIRNSNKFFPNLYILSYFENVEDLVKIKLELTEKSIKKRKVISFSDLLTF